MRKQQSQNADEVVEGRRLRTIGAFQTSELFVLSAVRLWCDRVDMPCRRAMVRNGFQAVGLNVADYHLFAEFMEAITTTASRPMSTATVGCAAPTRDETWLLECFALSQHRFSEAETFLATRLTPSCTGAVSGALRAFTNALTSAGLHLRVRSMEETRNRPRPATLWRPRSRAVH